MHLEQRLTWKNIYLQKDSSSDLKKNYLLAHGTKLTTFHSKQTFALQIYNETYLDIRKSTFGYCA